MCTQLRTLRTGSYAPTSDIGECGNNSDRNVSIGQGPCRENGNVDAEDSDPGSRRRERPRSSERT